MDPKPELVVVEAEAINELMDMVDYTILTLETEMGQEVITYKNSVKENVTHRDPAARTR